MTQRRRDLGLRQLDVAGRLHVSRQRISAWERGVERAPADLWPSLLDALRAYDN